MNAYEAAAWADAMLKWLMALIIIIVTGAYVWAVWTERDDTWPPHNI